MCGIAGIIDQDAPPTRDLLERMAAPLAKRGPDDAGYFLAGPVGLAHRRLSIIDLATGHQPMVNEDGTLVIVFNGEIYDYRRWRDELLAAGHRLRTQSDTEVLLHLYEERGPDMVRELNGMFAFVICHLPGGELFMARDRMGKKPLCFAVDRGRLAFGSGPQALAPVPWIDRRLDPTALNDYLEYQYVPTPLSIYPGVQKLPPGSVAYWASGRLTVEPYWKPELRPTYAGDYPSAARELRSRLDAAVARRLIADVPVGLFLSGGMDSGIITALAQRHTQGRAKTFAIGFPQRTYDERHYAAQVAAALGTEHHFLEVQPGDFAHLRQIVAAFEEPFCDSSMLPTALLAQFARQHVTVALSGDAADELFGGYYRYRVMRLLECLRLCPRGARRLVRRTAEALLPAKREERSFWGKARRLIALADLDGAERYLAIISRFPLALKQRLYGPAMSDSLALPHTLRSFTIHQYGHPGQAPIDALMEMELRTYLLDDILAKMDRASMAYALEVRSPFLDREVVDLALNLPYEWKQHGFQRKRILRDACRDLLPPAIFRRRKMGFGVPVAAWLRDGWQAPARELLLDGWFAREQYFQRPALESLLDDHVAGRADYSYAIFALMVLELWRSQCHVTSGQ